MKILMLTASMDSGGAETHIFELARGMKKMGEDAQVVSSGGRLAEELRAIGVAHTEIRLDRHSPIKFVRERKKLERIVENGGFDVIHAHSRISAFAVFPIAKKYGVSLVTTVHARFSLSPMYRRLARWGELTVAVSEDLRQYLCVSYGVSSENTRVIGNGVDTERFHPSDKGYIPHRVVFVSRLDRDCSSAALSLCKIAERLRERFGDTEVIVCGGGDALERVKETADGICSRAGAQFISVVGHVEDTAAALSGADVFVGVSRSALEALASGALAVLCGDEGGIGLVDGKECLRRAELTNFSCRGEKCLSEEKLLSELCRAFSMPPSERAELSRLCVEYVREFHSSEEMAKKTLEVYREAAEKRQEKGRVVLCGYYGYGNMGDNALLRASIRRAKETFGGRAISALTEGGKRDNETFGVRCVRRMSPLAVSAELKGAEALVFGGGTLLQDRTSLRSLVYYASVCELARLRGARVELWGNGLEAPHSRAAAFLVRRVLSSAAYIGLRDMPSVTEALRLVSPECGDRLFLEADLARGQTCAPPARVEYLQRLLGLREGENIAEYAVIAVKGSEGKGFIAILEEKLIELAAMGLSLVFLPMFPKEDGAECRRLSEELGGAIAEGVSESDAVGLMKESTVVCGMRLHALVFAAAAEVPFVGFGGDPKIESFCRENGGVYFTDTL